MNYKFYSRQSNFSATWGCHHTGDRVANLDLCLTHSWFLELKVLFSCHTYCDTGPRFIRSRPRDLHPHPTVGFQPGTQGSPDLCASTLPTAPQGWVIKYKILSNYIMAPSTVKLQLEGLFIPPKSKIVFFFLSFILSFCHTQKTLTWLWHFIWVFLVTRLFLGYQKIWPCYLDLGFDLLNKNFNLGNIFWMVCITTLIFHMCIPCDMAFLWL
jgi:hypothetical protein